MKALIRTILLIVILISHLTLYGQHAVVIAHAPLLKSHQGFAIMETHDTIYSTIKLDQFHKNIIGLTIQKDNKKRFISYKDLCYVRLFDCDSSLVITKFTEYKKLTDKPQLWQHIASGKIDIYDNVSYCNEVKDVIGDNLRIVDNGKIINISHAFSFFFNRRFIKIYK